MKIELHKAAVEELEKRKVHAAQNRKMKRQRRMLEQQLSPVGASNTNYQDFFTNDQSSLGTLDISLTNQSSTLLNTAT